MFRKSGLSVIALGLIAIGSATVPAAAFPKASEALGVKHVTINAVPAPSGAAGFKPTHLPVTMPPGLGKKPVVGSQPGAGTPAAPKPPVANLPIDICPLTHKCHGPIVNPGHDHDHDHGPIVIITPPVPVGIPVIVPGRVPMGGGMGVASQPRPVMNRTQDCGAAATIPALASGIDELLPNAHLSESDMTKVTSLRQTIQELVADGKEAAARDTEDVAMNILGYRKVWLTCGVGFDWVRQDASADAGQTK